MDAESEEGKRKMWSCVEEERVCCERGSEWRDSAHGGRRG